MSRLYDRLLGSDVIDQGVRTGLKSAVVISGDNVAEYYYSGTSQENWYVWRDFPNIAPPFENAFYDFGAPKWITSAEYGTKAWDNARPRAWGIWARTRETTQDFDLSKPPVRAEWFKRVVTDVRYMENYAAQLNTMAPEYQQDAEVFLRQLEERRTLQRMLRDDDQVHDAQVLFDQHFAGVKWVTTFGLFLEYRKGHPLAPIWLWDLYIREDGSMPDFDTNIYAMRSGPTQHYGRVLQRIAESGRPEAFFEANDSVGQFLHTALLTICFMHCSNVTARAQVPSQHTTKSTKNKRTEPLVTYHVLDIEPMRQVLSSATSGQSDTSVRRALHLCRGHFAHYTADKPLFGKYSGTIWVPQHVRGSKKRGLATKDYRVNV